ncbi:MAG TPA: response regulator [Tepidisphaeraceae bacterium]|nr:response regulator [Tepidisphaeraceae bacterium]
MDDQVESRSALARLLQAEGYEVVTAETGLEALTAAAAAPVDALVSDIGLPDIDGCELLRRLREMYSGDVPAVALTGYGEEHYVEECRRAGYRQFLLKPILFRELLDAVRSVHRSAM